MEPAARADGEDHTMFQHFISINQAMVDIFLKDTDLSKTRSDWKRNDIKGMVTQPSLMKFINQSLRIASNQTLAYDEMVTADFESPSPFRRTPASGWRRFEGC